MSFRLGIRQQVLLIALIPGTIITSVLTLYFILSGLTALDDEQQARGLAVAQYLAPAAEYDIVAGNRSGLQLLVQTAMNQRNVTAVSVVDTEGHTLALSGKTALSPMFLLKRPGELQGGTAGSGEDWQAFAAPVNRSRADIEDYLDGRAQRASEDTPDVVGWVFVELSNLELEQRKRQLLSNSVLILLIVLALTGFVASRLANRVVNPVTRLARAVADMADGDLHVRVPTDSPGELGKLEAGFNNMAVHLQDMHDTMQERIDRATAQLRHQARHDPLTGLINRREFESRAEHAIESAHLNGCSHALCYLDLDQFKIVNDSCGHAAGDELLRNLSELLLKRIRGQDVLARLGGDEFGVLLENCQLEDALRVTESLRQQVEDYRFYWREKVFVVGVSIGLIMIDARTRSLHEVLSAADRACYAAKEGGRNRVEIFSPESSIHQRDQRDSAWISRISSALSDNRLTLHAQRLHVLTGTSTPPLHVEFLLRMVEKDGELIPPMAFLPAAERFDLIADLDRWVVSHACSLIARISRLQADRTFCGSINLSINSICDEDFLPFIQTQLHQHALDAGQLCFELTEAVTTRNHLEVQRFACAIRALGCRLAFDEFGSGLSSFNHLQSVSPDVIKLGGKLLQEAMTSDLGRTLLQAIVDIAHQMHVGVVAERVDSPEIVRILEIVGIQWAQGELFSKAQPPENLYDLQPRETRLALTSLPPESGTPAS